MSRKRNEQKKRRDKAKKAAIARYREQRDASVGQNKKKERKRRRLPVFYIVYFAIIALFIAVLINGTGFLEKILAEYESALPEHTADEVFREYFAEPDIAELIEMSSAEYALFETHDRVIEYLDGQIEGKEMTFAPSGIRENGGVLRYNVFCAGARFAVFSIEQGGETTEHGFPIYRLGEVGLTFSFPDNGYGFSIPEGYTLYANGTKVSERYIAAEPVPTDAYRVTDGELGVRYVPYWVEGFLSTPTFEVRDRNGAVCEHIYDDEREIFTVEVRDITVTVPSGYTPYIGGHALGEEYVIAGSRQASVFNEFLHESAEPLDYVSYGIGGFLEMPEVTVRSPLGYECTVRRDEAKYTYTSLPAYNDALREEYADGIIESFELLTLYLQNIPEITKGEVRVYFDTSSEAWAGYSSIYKDWNFEAFYYRFEDESASDFIMYDEDHFSCRVRLRYIGNRTETAVYEDRTDKVVFFRRVGDRFLIYNMPNTESLSGLGI